MRMTTVSLKCFSIWTITIRLNSMRTLYRFNITDNIIADGKPKVIGHYEKVENLSEGLQKRLRENGLPLKMQEQLLTKR